MFNRFFSKSESVSLPSKRLLWWRDFLKTKGTFIILIVIGFGLFFVVDFASAGGLLGDMKAWASWTIGKLVSGAIWMIGTLIVWVFDFLIWIAQYNDFINSPAISKGWIVVRDVCNMFFVLLLLIIAIGTILNIKSYHYKQLLPKLLLMAILINFSKMICGIFIDLSQVVMMTFVNGFAATGAGNLISALQVDKLTQISADSYTEGNNIQFKTVIISLILALIMAIIILVVVAIMVLILVFRVIMIWILVVLSPIAFLLAAAPVGKKYGSQWWSEFFKYLIVGPVLAFFLWLSLATLGDGNITASMKSQAELGTESREQHSSVLAGEIGTFDHMVSYVIGIAMLIGGLMVTQQLGVVGGSVAGQAVSNIKKIGTDIALAPSRFAGRKMKDFAGGARDYGKRKIWEMSTRPGAGLIRRSFKYTTKEGREGFWERGKKIAEDAKTLAKSQAMEESTYLFSRGRQRIPYEETARNQIQGAFVKDYSHMDKEQKAYVMSKMWEDSSAEGKLRKQTMAKVMASGGHVDDALADKFFQNEVDWKDEKGKERKGFSRLYSLDEKGNQQWIESVDADGTKHFTDNMRKAMTGGEMDKETRKELGIRSIINNQEIVGDFLRASCGTDQSGLKTISDIGEVGSGINHFEYYGHVAFDTEKQKWINKLGKDAADQAMGELKKITPRKQMAVAPHNMGVIDSEIGFMQSDNLGGFERNAFGKVLERVAEKEPTEIFRYAQARLPLIMGGDVDDEGILQMTEFGNNNVLKSLCENQPNIARVLYKKFNAKGINVEGKEYANLNDLAVKSKWNMAPPEKVKGLEDDVAEWREAGGESSESKKASKKHPKQTPRASRSGGEALTEEQAKSFEDRTIKESLVKNAAGAVKNKIGDVIKAKLGVDVKLDADSMPEGVGNIKVSQDVLGDMELGLGDLQKNLGDVSGQVSDALRGQVKKLQDDLKKEIEKIGKQKLQSGPVEMNFNDMWSLAARISKMIKK